MMRLVAVVLLFVIGAAGIVQASAALVDVDAGAVDAVSVPANIPSPPCDDEDGDEQSQDDDEDENCDDDEDDEDDDDEDDDGNEDHDED